jgi:hypothetical protein
MQNKINAALRIHIWLSVFGLLIIFLSLLQPIQAQFTADGQPFILVSPISIDSPANTTYSINQVCLNVTVKSLVKNDADTTLMYSIDGNDNVTIPTSETLVPAWADVTYANGTKTKEISSTLSYYLISGFVDFENLQQGQHSLTVFARYDMHLMQKIAFDNKTVYFTIDDGSSPVISNIDIDDGVPKSESSNNIIYATVGVFSLITVVAYALFTKLKTKR